MNLESHSPSNLPAAARNGMYCPTSTTESMNRPPLRAGYGACYVNGCLCKSFMGSDQLCGNCGHNYSFHG